MSTSTIDPNIPATNAPLLSAPIRGNFLAAYNDINGILAVISGLGNMSTQSQNNVTITGGHIAGTTINAGTLPTSALAPGTSNTLAGYDNSGAFSGVTIGGNLILSGGVLSAFGGGIGGTNGQIQYNNAGLFGGFGHWDGTTFAVGGAVTGATFNGYLATGNISQFVNDAGYITSASAVTSVSGTANRITSTGGATPVIDIAANYVGQSSITTVGTITTGTWSGLFGAISGANLTNLTAVNISAGTAGINITGSAATLTTGRTISISGDLSYTSPSFNGSSNITAVGTLATVNSNVGTFGSASNVGTFTVNGKGLITAASNAAIQIAESQVTNLVSDLAGKQTTVSLTTTGTSGAATFNPSTGALNIPNYTSGGSGTVTTTGSPVSGNLTQFSGSTSITNGNLSGDITTSGTLATTVAKIAGTTVSGTTGTTNVVFSTSPNLTTPNLGAASATSINKIAITAPATSATLTLANGSTLATSGVNSITLTSTAATNITLPTSGTLTTTSNNLSVFASTTSAQLAGVISDETGTGALVFATSPSFITPTLGVATGTRLGLGQAADTSAVMAATGQYFSTRATTTTTLNWNSGNCLAITLANNGQTFTFANPKSGGRYILELKQPASGAAGTVTWPATVQWSGGTAPTLTATNGQTDIITFYYNGTNYAGAASLNYSL